jgi:endonuclease/exonuclease/phosphatase family metal-dependent hydrolase
MSAPAVHFPSGCTAAANIDVPAGARRLRLLSYNIQTGIATSKYRHYLTHSWKHVLPYPERLENLDRIAHLLHGFDIVGLQEVDAGSLRSGYINQTEYLALQAHYPFWHHQTNRNLGHLAQHSLGLLSRLRPSEIREEKLPGRIPGRGALVARYGDGPDALAVIVLHLALGRRARLQQLEHLSDVMRAYRHIVLMGDFNCGTASEEMNWLLARAPLREPVHGLHTFPSWRPARNIDHILVSPTLEVRNVCVLNQAISDHLPIMMDVVLPPEVSLPGVASATAERAVAVGA